MVRLGDNWMKFWQKLATMESAPKPKNLYWGYDLIISENKMRTLHVWPPCNNSKATSKGKSWIKFGTLNYIGKYINLLSNHMIMFQIKSNHTIVFLL